METWKPIRDGKEVPKLLRSLPSGSTPGNARDRTRLQRACTEKNAPHLYVCGHYLLFDTDAAIFTKRLVIVLDMVVPLLRFGFGYPKPSGPILDGYPNGFCESGAHLAKSTYPGKKVCDFSRGLAPPT